MNSIYKHIDNKRHGSNFIIQHEELSQLFTPVEVKIVTVEYFEIFCYKHPAYYWESVDNYGRNLLSYVIAYNNIDLLRYILTKRPDLVNWVDRYYNSPLKWTLSGQENYSCMELLLEFSTYVPRQFETKNIKNLKTKLLLETYIHTYHTSLKALACIAWIRQLKVPIEEANLLPDQLDYMLKIRDIHFKNKMFFGPEECKKIRKELELWHKIPPKRIGFEQEW